MKARQVRISRYETGTMRRLTMWPKLVKVVKVLVALAFCAATTIWLSLSLHGAYEATATTHPSLCRKVIANKTP